MQLIGITGRSGSGKSLVVNYYGSRGYASVDGDQISREVCGPGSPCVRELAEAFGPGILGPDGTLDRRRLASIAFASPEQTRLLADITHPHILEETARRMQAAQQGGSPLFFFEGAAIVGTPFQDSLDKLIVVVAAPELSLQRILLRDGLTPAAARQRLDAQTPEAALVATADYVIENNGTPDALLQRAEDVLQDLLQGAMD